MKDHSLEEIRDATIEVLAQSVNRDDSGGQYVGLKNAVGSHFAEREPQPPSSSRMVYSFNSDDSGLSRADANLFLEVFWGLVREGIICPGSDDLNNKFPFYRVTKWGREFLSSGNPFRFHDGDSCAALYRARIPDINPQTLGYISEAGHALAAGRPLAAGITLSFALEHALLGLFESIKNNPANSVHFSPVWERATPASQLTHLVEVLRQNPSLVKPPASDDLETQLVAAAAIIHRFRDDANNPNGQNINREDCTLLLQIFVSCCQKIYQLRKALT